MAPLQSFLHGMAEYLTPVKTSSSFREKGVLTPEEFVEAGDLLVMRCPSWTWESGESSKRRTYLPANKQYLVTRNVPCLHRVSAMEYTAEHDEEMDNDDGWTTTHKNRETNSMEDLPEISTREERAVAAAAAAARAGMEPVDDSMGVVEEDDSMNLWHGKSYMVAEEPKDNIVKTRTYDVCITYDKYYQTPRVWLFGYDENRHPLNGEQVFEDISQDHARRTVTIESHPHLSGVAYASIHPCRHSAVMKKIVDHLAESGKEARVDQYLFLFLKFISAVIPTIEYDFTYEMDA
eukprot:TRINITY_DN1150_c0_g1::TRINITY_DN1150_c0_g1_i1::g.17352::m.17352 TRINITY_DN1150_c0_g1::TRINITY_DN1150_c0_g1_i1::g.17352  ORF type:complete len:292 (-),score=48.86,sp/Q0WWQ1/ATG3_ARATH/50.16/3e-96,Autophagy_N/PF03986.8/6.3e-45,Autophagy_act_C/PF03987.10/1.6e-26,Autophagy_Cterm/PF10381.4/2.6e-14 TRINITY_DN1150_c0_g1_i1:138-1013(-)